MLHLRIELKKTIRFGKDSYVRSHPRLQWKSFLGNEPTKHNGKERPTEATLPICFVFISQKDCNEKRELVPKKT